MMLRRRQMTRTTISIRAVNAQCHD